VDLLGLLLGDGLHLLITITLTHLRHSSKIKKPQEHKKNDLFDKRERTFDSQILIWDTQFSQSGTPETPPFCGYTQSHSIYKSKYSQAFDAPLNF